MTLFRCSADRLLVLILGTLAFAAGSLVLLIVAFTVIEALPALRQVGPVRFLTDSDWRPTGGTDGRYGVLPMLAGSLAVTAGALLAAGPAGLLSALFSRFYAPRCVAVFYRRLIELLAGVPSVVFGFWGLVVLVPLINRIRPPGHSLLAGSLVLALMVLPTVALTAEAALRGVPRESLQAAHALGMGRWAIVAGIALPAARTGILTGMLLAAGRAVGETMAVVMVCGNVVRFPSSPFDPVRTVTANIALEMGYATQAHRATLFVTGLMLMAIIGGALALVEFMRAEAPHE